MRRIAGMQDDSSSDDDDGGDLEGLLKALESSVQKEEVTRKMANIIGLLNECKERSSMEPWGGTPPPERGASNLDHTTKYSAADQVGSSPPPPSEPLG
jgi:hypothetical protein